MSSGLRMNMLGTYARINNESKVLRFLGIIREHGRHHNTPLDGTIFSEIQKYSKLNNSTLHGVLKRLVERGWIIKNEGWNFPSGHDKFIGKKPSKEEFVSIIEEEFRKEVSKDPIISRKGKRTKKQIDEAKIKAVYGRYMPKKVMLYALHYFPYVDEKGNLPIKNKRFWKKEAKDLEEFIRLWKKNDWQFANTITIKPNVYA